MKTTRTRSDLGVAVTLAGAASAFGLVVFVIVPPVLGIDFESPTSPTTYLAFLLVLYATAAFVIGGYLALSDRGLGYLDVRIPTVRDIGYVVGGLSLDFALMFVLSQVMFAFAVPGAPATIFERIQLTNPANILVFIPFALLINAPLEEALFRGLVQKRLYGSYSRGMAVLFASLLFASFHLPVFYAVVFDPSPPLVGIAAALVFWFEGGLVYGFVYERTDNLVVPVLVHGVGNAVLSTILYVSIT